MKEEKAHRPAPSDNADSNMRACALLVKHGAIYRANSDADDARFVPSWRLISRQAALVRELAGPTPTGRPSDVCPYSGGDDMGDIYHLLLMALAASPRTRPLVVGRHHAFTVASRPRLRSWRQYLKKLDACKIPQQ